MSNRAMMSNNKENKSNIVLNISFLFRKLLKFSLDIA